MATASVGVRAGAALLAEGSKEDVGEGVLSIRSHFMALFSLRASSDPDVVDFKMWTPKSEEGESYPTKEVVCAYRTRDKMNEKEHDGGSTKEKGADGRKSQPDQSSFVKYFELYLRLKRGAGVMSKYGHNTITIVFYTGEGDATFPAEMVEQAKEKDYMFRKELLKCKVDVKIRKELTERISKEFILMVKDKEKRGSMRHNCKCRLQSDIEGFIKNSYFSTSIHSKEDLRQSLMKGIRADSSGCTDERERGMFPDVTEKNHNECKTITGATLRVCLEGEKIGRGEGSKMKFNLRNPVSDFVGRGKELQQMLYFLGVASSQWEVGPAKKVVVLSGYGGFGKSELAREYCRRHSSLYDNIAWIHAENEESIAASFMTLATEKLGMEMNMYSGYFKDPVTVSKECFDLLKTRKTLLVFDSAESLQKVNKYLPGGVTKGRVHIILTSRSQEWNDIPLIILENFHPKEALELVKGSLGQLSGWGEDEGQSLCKALGYYPLALKQAVSYILEQQMWSQKYGTTYRINDYLSLMEIKPEVLMDIPIYRNIEGGYTDTTDNVMMTTLKLLKETWSGQMAITVLNILSYLSPDDIDVERMCEANSKYNKEMVLKSLSILAKLSVISLDIGNVRIHKMVQLLNRNKLRESGQEVGVLRDAMVFAVSMGVHHLLSVWEWALEHRSLVVKFAHVPLGIFKQLDKEGLHNVALTLSLSAEEHLRNVLGQRHSYIFNVMKSTEQSYSTLVDKKKALSKSKVLVDSIRSLREQKSPEYFDELLSYGKLLSETWDVKETLSVFKEIVSDGPSILGEDSNVVQEARSKLYVLENDSISGINYAIDFTRIMEWSKEKLKSVTERKHSAFKNDEFVRCHNVEEIPIGEIDICKGTPTLPSTPKYLPILGTCRRFLRSFQMLSTVYEVAERTSGEDHPLSLSIKYELIKLQIYLGRIDAAQIDMDLLLAHTGPGFRDNKFMVEVENLRGLTLLQQGRNREAFNIFQSLCMHRYRDDIDEEGLYTVSNTLKYLLTMENPIAVSRIMKKICKTLCASWRKEQIPKPFLDFSFGVCLTLNDKGLHNQALGILQNLLVLYKSLMGESHMETNAVKLALGSICCIIGDEDGIEKGVRYFEEIRGTLLAVASQGDQKVLDMTYEVTKLLLTFSPEDS